MLAPPSATAALALGVPVRLPWGPAGVWALPGGHIGGSSGFARAGAARPWGRGVSGVRPLDPQGAGKNPRAPGPLLRRGSRLPFAHCRGSAAGPGAQRGTEGRGPPAQAHGLTLGTWAAF